MWDIVVALVYEWKHIVGMVQSMCIFQRWYLVVLVGVNEFEQWHICKKIMDKFNLQPNVEREVV
jgi:hypothetical protein